MVKLFRCEICGDPYIGETAPDNCPFCGAHRKYIKEFKESNANFDVQMSDKDQANAKTALQVEISNAAFYFCASASVKDIEGQKLFKALGKVESEHADIWKKILKLETYDIGKDKCSVDYTEDLKESHAREERAIEFYRKAASESKNERVRQIFEALVEVELDHLKLSEERLK